MIYGKKIFNWKGIHELDTIEAKKAAIIERAAEFMKEMQADPLRYEHHKLAGPDAVLMGGANPVAMIESDTVKTPDRGYEVLFDEFDMRASSNDAFDLIGITGGVTFYQILPGEEVKLSMIPKARAHHRQVPPVRRRRQHPGRLAPVQQVLPHRPALRGHHRQLVGPARRPVLRPADGPRRRRQPGVRHRRHHHDQQRLRRDPRRPARPPG